MDVLEFDPSLRSTVTAATLSDESGTLGGVSICTGFNHGNGTSLPTFLKQGSLLTVACRSSKGRVRERIPRQRADSTKGC